LKTRKDGDNFAIGFNDLGSDGGTGTVFREKFEERGVVEVFFEVGALVESFGVNFRNRKIVAAKVFGEGEEGGVFFPHAIENADSADGAGGEADDFAARTAEFALEGLDAFDGAVEVVFEERFENVDGHGRNFERFPF
jgi:hypothetical protein